MVDAAFGLLNAGDRADAMQADRSATYEGIGVPALGGVSTGGAWTFGSPISDASRHAAGVHSVGRPGMDVYENILSGGETMDFINNAAASRAKSAGLSYPETVDAIERAYFDRTRSPFDPLRAGTNPFGFNVDYGTVHSPSWGPASPIGRGGLGARGLEQQSSGYKPTTEPPVQNYESVLFPDGLPKSITDPLAEFYAGGRSPHLVAGIGDPPSGWVSDKPFRDSVSDFYEAVDNFKDWSTEHYNWVNPPSSIPGVRVWDPVIKGVSGALAQIPIKIGWSSIKEGLGFPLTEEEKRMAAMVDKNYQSGKAADYNAGYETENYEGVGIDYSNEGAGEDPGGGSFDYISGNWVERGSNPVADMSAISEVGGDIGNQDWGSIADSITAQTKTPVKWNKPTSSIKDVDIVAKYTARRAQQAATQAKAMADKAETERQVQEAARATATAANVQRSIQAAAARVGAGPEGQTSHESVAAPKAPSAKAIRNAARAIQQENKAIASAAAKRNVTPAVLRKTHEYVSPDVGRTKRVQKKAPKPEETYKGQKSFGRKFTAQEKFFIDQGATASGGGGER